MEFLLILSVLVFLVAVQMMIPYLTKRTVVFGVSVPDEYINEEIVLGYKKKYSLLMFIAGVAAIGIYVLSKSNASLDETALVFIGLILQFSLIFLSTALYFYFHAKIMKRKKTLRWGANQKQVKMTDLSVRSQDSMLPWHIFLLPIVVTIGVIIYTLMQYSLLPDQIPTHWGPSGKPDAFTDKSYLSAIALPVIMFVMQVMFLSINEGTKRSGIKLSATRTEASRVRQLTLRKYTSWFMFLTTVLITMLFTFFQLQAIHPNIAADAVLMVVPIAFLFIIMISSIVYAVKVGNAGENIAIQSKDEVADLDEDQYWKGGLIYFNKNDPSIFVEKRFGIGWTINFANPLGLIIMFGPIIIILGLTLIL